VRPLVHLHRDELVNGSHSFPHLRRVGWGLVSGCLSWSKGVQYWTWMNTGAREKIGSMIRLYFTPADLGKITLAPAPNALLEITTSVHRLHRWRAGITPPRPGSRRWHREVGGSLEARAGVLFDLMPRRQGGRVPNFLLQASTNDLTEAIERVSQTSEAQLAGDLAHLAPYQEAARSIRELASGAARAQQVLADDVRDYFNSSLAALWAQVQAAAVADRARRSEILLRGGTDALLATLGAGWRWQPPILHIPVPFTADIDLRGRGLLLIASYFALGPAVAMAGPDQATILIYPMHLEDGPYGSTDALGSLLGHTRAAVLASLRAPATTTALADRVGISLPSASQHTAALRKAGLISTARRGMTVQHTLTPLGGALLHGESTHR
jgi:DNA-binding transcriptional ArsR family regulator